MVLLGVNAPRCSDEQNPRAWKPKLSPVCPKGQCLGVSRPVRSRVLESGLDESRCGKAWQTWLWFSWSKSCPWSSFAEKSWQRRTTNFYNCHYRSLQYLVVFWIVSSVQFVQHSGVVFTLSSGKFQASQPRSSHWSPATPHSQTEKGVPIWTVNCRPHQNRNKPMLVGELYWHWLTLSNADHWWS